MGMFDYVRCALTVPHDKQSCVFQTKNLACALNEYHIDGDGQLWQVAECGDDGITPITPTKVPYSGTLEFYGTHLYYADFVDGVAPFVYE